MRSTSTVASKNGPSTLEVSSFPRLRSQTVWYMLRLETEGFCTRSTSRQAPKSGAEALSTISSHHHPPSQTGKSSTVTGAPRAVSSLGSLLPWTQARVLFFGQTQHFLPLPWPPRRRWIVVGSSLDWTMDLSLLSTSLMARHYGEQYPAEP